MSKIRNPKNPRQSPIQTVRSVQKLIPQAASHMPAHSSITICPWSDSPNCLPASGILQIASPQSTKKPRIQTISGPSQMKNKRGKIPIVPVVPGAFGDKPLPSPTAIQNFNRFTDCDPNPISRNRAMVFRPTKFGPNHASPPYRCEFHQVELASLVE